MNESLIYSHLDMSTLTEIVLLSEHIPVTCQILQLNMSRIFLNFFLRQKQFHLTYSAVNSEGLVPNEVCFGLITKDLPVLSNTPSIRGTAVAQWLRCCATNQKVTGSIPACQWIFH